MAVVREQLVQQKVLAWQEVLVQQMGLSLQGGLGVAFADCGYNAFRCLGFWDVQSIQYSAVMHAVLWHG